VPFPPKKAAVTSHDARAKYAVTDFAALIVTLQAPLPVQAPPHLRKDELAPAVARRVTTCPLAMLEAQEVAGTEQLTGAGVLWGRAVTVPSAPPDATGFTVRV
jgi:hypothetical protein